jgi:hypothetical protein
MGICKSNGKYINPNISSIKHIQTIGDQRTDAYNFALKRNNSVCNKKLNLKFIFYNFKVKYCISHKETKDSIYITEIKIGEKIFPPIINQGQSPNIPNLEDAKNGYFIEKSYTLNELENTYLLINVYELTEDIDMSPYENSAIPDELKAKCSYNSFFSISLLSFLFKSMRCDFPMMGNNNQLSTKTRISFYCFIEHREKILIKAQPLSNPNINKLVYKTNDSCEKSDKCILNTPPITMSELSKMDLFLESNESFNNYEYISLNGLKADIIKQLGNNVINLENDYNDINLRSPLNIRMSQNNSNNLFSEYGNEPKYNQIKYNTELRNNKAFLLFDNLPIVCQISNLYFTEYGNVYNTAFLNLINDDLFVHKHRASKQISSDNFYEKLSQYFEELKKDDYDFTILNDIHTLFMRSIDTERFMFLYQTLANLNKMIILFLKVAIIIIRKLRKTEEDYKIIVLTKLINILMRREELDNCVLYECIKAYESTNENPKELYNTLMIELFLLYELLISNKYSPYNDSALIELFSRLYFQKKYIRSAILNTLNEQEYELENKETIHILLYDVINDKRLNKYLYSEAKNYMKNYLKTNTNFKNRPFDTYRLLKRILSFMNDDKIHQYPLEFTLFPDNINILKSMQRDINEIKYDRTDRNKLTNDFYESVMLLSNSYFSISYITNTLIYATNGHNTTAVYTLFVYFKSLFDYYYTSTNSRLLMDYSELELASKLLTDNEDSISLPRLFWFYYCCSHMMTTANVKWFIVNIINKNFDKFAFHWSFSIRQVFFKLVIFIYLDKLFNEEGKLFMKEKLLPFAQNNVNTMKSIYVPESIKDYKTITKEYSDWFEKKKENNNIDFPLFFLPPPISNNGVIE